MSKRSKYKVPQYFGFRIYFLATLLYFFLVFPVSGILTFKYGPEWMQERDGMIGQNNDNNDLTIYPGGRDTLHSMEQTRGPMPSKSGTENPGSVEKDAPPQQENPVENTQEFAGTISLLLKLLLISFVLGFIFNLPFKIYFKKKRKGKEIPPRLYRYCKKLLLKTPIIDSGILFLAYGIVIIYMAYTLFIKSSFDNITQKFYEQFFFITLMSSLLTLMFVYFWQKHRVHIRYIEHIFSREELRKRIFSLKEGRIKNRMWISSAMTTLIPLAIVIFYLFISITAIKEINIEKYDPSHLDILIGKYAMYLEDSDGTLDFLDSLFYVNAFDSLLMFLGIFTGIFIAFIYILFFIRWTTQDIVYPVGELLENMQRTGRGEMDSYSIVRTNDEIGELTEGYNDMTHKLKNYIVNISRMNEANARFVPQQFLDFLGKDNIADIHLGDQVQKEMSILFTDIRNFTQISEQMTPKENFNFLNNYLGYMEPVIRNNNGFIDKFMGDSIMALFPDKAEDAINAAIEMKIKLQEFNHIMSQFGHQAITTGTGIHTGMLMLGVVGGEGRMDGTVISDAVNLTSRLEGLTKIYGSSMIISEDTLINVSDPTQYNYRFLDIVQVKGKKKTVYIFEVLDGDKEMIKALKTKTKSTFSKGLQAYKDGKFTEAIDIFQAVVDANPSDKAAHLYIRRCEQYLDKGYPEDWDGIEKF